MTRPPRTMPGSRRLSSPRRLVATLFAIFAISAPPLGTQGLPQGAGGALRWRLLGPFRGGRVLAVSGIPGDPRTFYFGSVAGGVWKTENAGVTWVPLFDHAPISSVGAIALAPSDPHVIYVGTGEADMRSDISYGNGVYRSRDGGIHWDHVGLDDTRHIGKILVDPRNPELVFVAALGHAYGPNTERGVFRSADGGQTWQRVLYRDENTGAIDLALSPDTSGVIYAALWQVRRPPWSQYAPDEGPGSGLYRSNDGGSTWIELTGHGLPDAPLGRIGVAAGPHGRVYALIEAHGSTALYRSEDAGGTWRPVARDRRFSRTWYFGEVVVDPANPARVYLPGVALLRSTDGGATFTAFKGQPGGDDYHALWIDPQEPERMIAGSDQGAVVTEDGGRSWSSWYNQPTAQFYHVATDEEFPYRVLGAQQDAGSVAIRSRSDYGLITFRDWAPTGAGESGYIAPDPLDSNIVYGGDIYGGVLRFDRRTNQSQNVSPWPVSQFSVSMPERKYRAPWTSPLVFDRADPRLLLFGTQVLLGTRDGGLHWHPLSPDLTGGQSGRDTGAVSVATAAARGYGTIYTIAPSPVARGVVWVGTDDGLVHLTTDGGRTWRNVTPAGLAPWSKISLIEASPFDTGAAYAAVDRHRLDDLAPYIYRTTDRGAHWTRIDQGIAPAAYVHVVRADPRRRGLLYAGTETGVYVSFDDGAAWEPLQFNLPRAPVHDLVVKNGDLVAATHGRAFWILDDLTPLETPTLAAPAPLRLFPPRAAIRLRRTMNQDTPLPPEEPHGENPPAGAVIDYALAVAPSEPVTLEIRDTAGRLVRRWSSADRFEAPSEPPSFTVDWLPRADSLSARPGLNRFVWNLRYPAPPTDEPSYSIAAIAGQGTVADPEGPLAPPGTYQVTLHAGTATATALLTVRADPREHVPAAVLVAQRDFALHIGGALEQEHATRDAVRAVGSRLDSLPRDRLDDSTRASLGRLRAALDTLGRGLLRVGAELAELETVVVGADREPPAQVHLAFQDAHERLAALLVRWQRVSTQTIPQLNSRLIREGLAPIPPSGGQRIHAR